MTDVATDPDQSELVKNTHPIRGILWGLLFGLGLAIVLVVTLVITLSIVSVLITIVVGAIIGTLWSIFGPAKKPKESVPEPASETTAAVPPPPSPVEETADGAADAEVAPVADDGEAENPA